MFQLWPLILCSFLLKSVLICKAAANGCEISKTEHDCEASGGYCYYYKLSCTGINETDFIYGSFYFQNAYQSPERYEKIVAVLEITNSNISITSIANKLEGLSPYTLNLTNILITGGIEDVFTIGSGFQVLDLGNNQLLPSAFHGCQGKQLMSIVMSLKGSNFTHLTKDVTSCATSYNALDLSYCGIQVIENNTFASISQLSKLYLSNNNITSLNKSLSGISSLEILYLNDNRIETISGELPRNPRLTYIDLSNNRLKLIPSDLFDFSLYYHPTILLNHNKFESIDQITVDTNKNPYVLDLSHSNLRNVSLHSFKWIQPTYLNLSYSNIGQISANTLEFSRVSTADISHSQIHEIQANAFSHVIGLTYLNLTHNNLTHIKNFTFNSTSFRQLDLSFSGIEYLEYNAFYNLGTKKLLLRGNQLTSIDFSVFCLTENLKEIDLSRNLIEHLQMSEMQCKNEIYSIDLSESLIRNISGRAFAGLRSLQILDLSNNLINILPEEEVFLDLTALKFLNLSNNNVSHLWPHFGKTLINIATLDLSNNAITRVSANTFDSTHHLGSLYLAGNNITSIDNQAFSNEVNIKVLNLTYNGVVKTGMFARVSNLVNLTFVKSHIYLQERSFYGLPNLRALELDNVEVNMTQNHVFEGAISLSNLNLSRIFAKSNLLREGMFTGLESLKEIDLSSSNIRSIECNTFKSLDSLKELRLSYNEIYKMEIGSFNGLKNVIDLYLDNNRIEDEVLQFGIFSGLGKLTTLDLSYNKLSYLDETVNSMFPLENLQNLYLYGNSFRIIPESDMTFDILPRIIYIGISENKWQCSHLFKLLRALKRQKISYRHQNESCANNVNNIQCSNK